MEHVQPHDDRLEGVAFVFGGGRITPDDVLHARPASGEIRSAALLTPALARTRVKPLLAARIGAAVDAVGRDRLALCEHGVPPRSAAGTSRAVRSAVGCSAHSSMSGAERDRGGMVGA